MYTRTDKLKQWMQVLRKESGTHVHAGLYRLKDFFSYVGHIFALAARGFMQHDCALKSSALTFLSALSIVPAVVMAYGISQGFGFDIEEELMAMGRGQEAILQFAFDHAEDLLSKTRRDLIAGVGLVVLFYTIMRLLHNIEDIFNSIWDIKKHRNLQRKLADYTAVLLVSPLLVVFSSSLNVSITAQVQLLTEQVSFFDYVSPFLQFLLKLLPYTLVWILLGLLYTIMPNTKVKAGSAAWAGVIAGTLFQTLQWAYINFQIGVSSYNAIYGSLAALPLFLVWMQLSWNITLFGAELAFAHQHAKMHIISTALFEISEREKRYVSLLVVHLLAKRFATGAPPLPLEDITEHTRIPQNNVKKSVEHLCACNLLSEVMLEEKELKGYQPALDIHKLTPRFVIETLEKHGIRGIHKVNHTQEARKITQLLSRWNYKEYNLNVDKPLVKF